MRNGALKTLYVYNGIFVFAGSLLGPLYAVYVGLIDSNLLAVSLSWGAYLFATLGFTLLVSRMGDHVREKEFLLLAGMGIRAVVWFLFIFASSFGELVALQVVLGLGEALGTPSFNAIFAEHLDDGHYVKEYADWSLITYATTGIGTILGGYVVVTFGFPWLFSIMSILALSAFIGIALKPRSIL